MALLSSSPYLRNIAHSDITVGTSKILIVDFPDNIATKRVAVVIQNKSTSATIQVIGNATNTVGLAVAPLSSISFDNYNGQLYAVSTASGTTVHIAISAV